jgi:hypothetical protein
MNWAYLLSTLRGGEKLSIVFWYYNVLGVAGAALVASALAGIAMFLSAQPNPNLALVGFAFLVPYWLWAIGSLWQCAFNVQPRVWGYLARSYVIYCLVVLLFGVVEVVSDAAAS